MDKKDLLDASLNALDRLLKMFMVERFIYLALTSLSFIILLYTAYLMFSSQSANREILLAVFGGSGLIAASSVRISWFFNRAFTLVENLVKELSK